MESSHIKPSPGPAPLKAACFKQLLVGHAAVMEGVSVDMCTCKKMPGEWWECCVEGEEVVRSQTEEKEGPE